MRSSKAWGCDTGYIIEFDGAYFSKIYTKENDVFLGYFPLDKAKVYKTRKGAVKCIEKLKLLFPDYNFDENSITEVRFNVKTGTIFLKEDK